MDWNDIFYYDNGKLRRKFKSLGSGKFKADSEVGTMCNHGYLSTVVSIRGIKKRFKVHRIIWEMLNNDRIPEGMCIDHINHIRNDNRIENLRVVSRVSNQRNQSLRNDNSSGYVGVSFSKSTAKWEAYINVSGKKINLGLFATIDDAYAARIEASKKYNFHKNHGEKK